MDNTFKIELVNDNEYTVQAEAEGQKVESLFRTDPDYLARIGLGEADGKRVVEETARFLSEHQPVIDFPSSGPKWIERLIQLWTKLPPECKSYVAINLAVGTQK
jgi:hypothetical protein